MVTSQIFEDLQDDQEPSCWVGQEMVDDGGHGTKGEEDSIRNQAKIKTGKAPKYHQIHVTERSRKLLRDVRLRGGLKVRCCSALSYFFGQ